MKHHRDSQRFYLAASAASGYLFATTTTVNLVYMVEVAHLDALQMVLIGTALELSAFLFEIPTGVLADAVSRRLSVIVGHVLTGIGFMIVAMFPTFTAILLAQVVWGIGWTFISGAYPAWLSDEIGVARANQTFVRAAQLSQIASLFGIATAVWLAHHSLDLPILLGGAGYIVLAAAMAFLMQETRFKPVPRAERSTWSVMGTTFRAGVGEVRGKPLLVLILLFTALYGTFSEGLDRLYTPFLIDEFEFPALGPIDDVTWWGVIGAVASVCAFVTTSVARRYVDTDNDSALATALVWLTGGIALAVVLLANVDVFFAVLVGHWLAQAMRAARGPLATAWFNRNIPSHSRATLLSMYGQADSAGQALGGPVIGYVAKAVSIGFALTLSAITLLLTLPLYGAAARRGDAVQDRRARAGAARSTRRP